MKGVLCACLLALALSMAPARAYESDIHYSTTYVLARAAGWTQAEAVTIASANQGVDENQDTVAALEVDARPGHALTHYLTSSFRQADKNLKFHCFSRAGNRTDEVAADVLEVMSRHFAAVADHERSRRGHTRRLIALGVALHCQQDAHSHVDFGGSCGAHAGSCYGHTHETLFDHVVFRLVGKHYFNPDHPAVSGPRLFDALRGTLRALSQRRPGGPGYAITNRELMALSRSLGRSGLELPDDRRRECNRYIAGQWLFDLVRSAGRNPASTDVVETLTPAVAAACGNASLTSARVIRIPEPRFPRLNADGSPHLVSADGSYQRIPGGHFEDSLPGVHPAHDVGRASNYPAPTVRVQLSHWSQFLALPLLGQAAASAAHSHGTPQQAGRKLL